MALAERMGSVTDTSISVTERGYHVPRAVP